MAYLTTAELKAYLAITDADDDAVLAVIIASAQAAIDRYTKRTFEPHGPGGGHHPHYFTPIPQRKGGDLDDSNSRILWLNDDLCEVQTVVNGNGVTIPSTEYITNNVNFTPWYSIELKRGSAYSWTYTGNSPEKSVIVTGKWCFALQAPADVKMAMYKLCKAWYNGRADSTGDRDILSTDGVVLVQSKIPSDVTAILNTYRRLSL
jgi:hypothetical protein